MKQIKLKNGFAMFCNLAVVVFTVMCVLSFFQHTGDGNMAVSGTDCFRYFTIDSNILAALTSIIALWYNMNSIRFGKEAQPQWAGILQLIGTAAVTLTLLTVVLFLGPTIGYDQMFVGSNLYLHLINPLLAIISLCLTGSGRKLTIGQSLLGMLPTVVYGGVYITLVLITKQWEDFYGFNMGGGWYLSLPLMLLASALICIGLASLRNLCSQAETIEQ